MITTDCSDESLRELAQKLAQHCLHQGWQVVTAESCTGGWIGKVCTDLPGSSGWFAGGLISYSNTAKTSLLGVPEDLLERFGAVSEPVALAMAEGALSRTNAHLSVAVSGIAGPGGATLTKAVGTVCLAWATQNNAALFSKSLTCQFSGDRESVRRQTVAAALRGLLDMHGASAKTP